MPSFRVSNKTIFNFRVFQHRGRNLSSECSIVICRYILGTNINNFFFEEKKSKIKKSVIILDDTIKLIDDLGHIRFHEDKKLLSLVINNFILDKIDNYGFNGDFIESQAFGYLAIRSFLNLPISFPSTTGCKKPTLGGKLVENF